MEQVIKCMPRHVQCMNVGHEKWHPALHAGPCTATSWVQVMSGTDYYATAQICRSVYTCMECCAGMMQGNSRCNKWHR